MTENAKTICFVVIGMIAVALGLISRPAPADLDENTLVGADLTKSFTSVEDAKRLRIIRFDEDTATLREFEVAEEDGLWTIPSKDNYPADAARQMAEAATSLMDRKILQVASTSAGDHEQFGVIDPMSPKLEPGQKGVGTRVTVLDEQKDPLVDLIVGKLVKDTEDQRYVREAGRNLVYVIEIDRSKLSTNFEDWIEQDLLKLNAWDLAQVDVKDYSASLFQGVTPDGQRQLGIDRDDRGEFVLDYSDSEGKWTAVKLATFDRTKGENGEYVEFNLAEDEELNEKALNDLKTALDDLQIVDVVKKPEGLSQDLKAGAEFLNNQKTLLDLMSRGFTPIGSAAGGPQDIISSDGEVIATMKDGVEYVLRFGNLTDVATGEKQDEGDAKAGDAAADTADTKSNSDVHRYMFVMARFNDQAIKQPELEPLPELPASEEAKPEESAAPAEDAAADGAPAAADAAPPADTAEEPAAPADDAKAASSSSDEEAPKADAEAAGTEAAKEDADAAKGEEAAADGEDAKKDEAPSAEATAKAKEIEKIMAERKRIEQENQRKTDEYQATVKKGQESMKELNLRFGDWYFVVDDDVFQKIRVGRDDIIKKKEAPAAEGDAPAGAANPFPAGLPAGLPSIPGAAPAAPVQAAEQSTEQPAE